MLRRMRALPLVAVALVAAACGGGDTTDRSFPEDALAIRANVDIAVGTERLLVGVSLPDGTRLGSPDDTVTLEVRPGDDDAAAPQRVAAAFSWIVPGVTGLYRGTFDFDAPGIWQVQVFPDRGPPLDPAFFSVLDRACRLPDAEDQGIAQCALQVGDAAPAVATPTAASNPIEEITTDPEPDERLYRLSLDEAIANGRPTVVVFATPAFCQTSACGPLVDTVEEVIGDYPAVDFVHVEVYTGFRDPGFDPSDPDALAPAVVAFRLVNEPWVFVIDETGTIVARFEGVMDRSELDAVLEAAART